MRLMTIASGSSGNSCYIGTDNTTLLLDVGISMKAIQGGLSDIDLSLKDVDGILITHEHIDHIKSIGSISRKYNIPIYLTYGTIDGILQNKNIGSFDYNLFIPISDDASFMIGDILVKAHSISHDANDPVCYTFYSDNKKAAVATDLGIYDDLLIDFLSESDAMVIEANHDIRMLEAGAYPFYLKKRILGERGHLCNEASGKLIYELLNDHLKYISLGHLSDKNNFPELAFETVKQELTDNPFSDDVRDFGLNVAPRNSNGILMNI